MPTKSQCKVIPNVIFYLAINQTILDQELKNQSLNFSNFYLMQNETLSFAVRKVEVDDFDLIKRWRN